MPGFFKLPRSVSESVSGVDDDAGDFADVVEGHGVDVFDDLVGGELAAEVILLAGDAGHAAGGRFERKQDRALQMELRAGQFLGGSRLRS